MVVAYEWFAFCGQKHVRFVHVEDCKHSSQRTYRHTFAYTWNIMCPILKYALHNIWVRKFACDFGWFWRTCGVRWTSSCPSHILHVFVTLSHKAHVGKHAQWILFDIMVRKLNAYVNNCWLTWTRVFREIFIACYDVCVFVCYCLFVCMRVRVCYIDKLS